jgi:cation-transporting P-type ATPase E
MPDYRDPSLLRGLTESEAARRRAAGQGNTALPHTGRTYRQIIVENVFTFINVVLFALGVALALLGRVSDAVVSTTIISLNVLVSVVQEIRAKRALDKIALLTRPRATVVRDGQARQVMPEELVIGDVLKVEPGDQIVLDGTLIGDGQMQADESALTGESDLIPKVAGASVFSGSFCVSGSACYQVEKVGLQSLANQITSGARSFRRVLTPMQETIYGVIRVFLVIVVFMVCLLALNAFLEGVSLADSVENSALVAGLVPNGLFISISIAYTLAAVRIARLGALVQQANAIESLSHVDVLCLDKTGTLTANRLQFNAVHPLGAAEPELRAVLGEMVASARTGNKTSETLATALPGPARPVSAEVPFSSARKWSAVAFNTPERQGVYALGAPEFLRPHLALDDAGWQAVVAQANTLADQGLRVLAVAGHADPAQLVDQGDASKLPAGMRLLGLVSLSDELRPEAGKTLAAFIEAGVQPKIISGDNPETVAALARQAGLKDAKLISGLELEQMDETQFSAAANEASIFGRVTPKQKERLIRALKASGHYVAMIGDGVNDVLSLKQAHLAVAMESGSQATRGVADIVLLKDSFASLVPAVSEGQRILNGMQDILKLYLTRVATMALLIASSQVVGFFPLGLRQGSALTLFSVGIPTVMLALWARPGPATKRGLTSDVYHFIATPMVMTTVIGLMLFYGVLLLHLRTFGGGWGADLDLLLLRQHPSFDLALESARSALAIFMVLAGIALVVLVEPPNAWWASGDVEGGDWRPTWLALGLAAVFVLMNLTPLREIFALSPVNGYEVLAISVALLAWLLAVRFFWQRRVIARFVGAPGDSHLVSE